MAQQEGFDPVSTGDGVTTVRADPRSGRAPFPGTVVVLEVTADRIVGLTERGDGYELRRVAGGTLEVKKGRQDSVYLEFTVSGDVPGAVSGFFDVGAFDVAAVRAAALAHGWPWRDQGAQAPAGSGTPAAPRQGREVVVRDGRSRTTPSRSARTMLLVVALLLGGALYGSLRLWPEQAGWLQLLGLPAGLALLGLIVATFARAARAARCTVDVDRFWLTVLQGPVAGRVVRRSAVATADAGRTSLRLRDARGRRLLTVPLDPARGEVLSALRAYGWPAPDESR